jgi:hypothetical protein
VIEIELKDGVYLVRGPKCLLVLTKAQFIAALQAGKRWKRRAAFKARLAAVQEDPCPTSGSSPDP